MNPRRRRHNRHARKRRVWERLVQRMLGGTWSNVVSKQPITAEDVQAAVDRVKKLIFAGSPVFVGHEPPKYEYKIRGYFNFPGGR